MRAYVPYLVLAVFIVLSSILYIGGCAIDKNWYPLFEIFPSLLTCFFAYCFCQAEPSGSWSDSRISEDAWMFLTFFGITSTYAFPIILNRVGTLSWKGLTFQICGNVSTTAGFILYIIFTHQVDFNSI